MDDVFDSKTGYMQPEARDYVIENPISVEYKDGVLSSVNGVPISLDDE